MMSMKLHPLGDRVVVKPTPQEEMTKSGLYLPDTADKEKKAEGEIIAIGNGEKVRKLNLKVGQKVVYSQYGGSEFKVDKVEYKILGEDDLLAVLE
ncbi:MAG: co-chaperone GroES [Candidatus Komeilibacteria bacterium RIFCSPLOWO2_01_FULL_52_15]|uniref:Co-chaperonin GroES n=2 Tax=Candidatus Komeiliibacteriota TaxID=1817908 RepID=A0A1G2BRK0_9BACT|nr:MAG: co-chaperone GroES [Candidatus Komeilibacteria bacterium RIFCSPHIGHO2_01_FULL_52_14]OGY91209.1 MAG: co-chaperone GroES [Candidatus Komeilibacteria bacterium RIFCSPLOWO2_01_FULL_52_15]